jgi:GT2 family glycosyltransferase
MLKVLHLKSCNEAPILSIVMLNYNSSKFLDIVKGSVQSILQMPLAKEVIIVDNGSTDGSNKELLELLMKQGLAFNHNISCTIVKVVFLQRNLGFSNGINIALKFVSKESKYIMIVNNDVVVYSEGIVKLIKLLEHVKRVGCVQGKILKWSETVIDSAGCLITEFGDWLKIGHGISKQYFSTPYLITYSHAALTICRREIFTGFLPYFFVFGDDFELGTRLYVHGLTVLYYPVIAGKHLGSATSKFNKDIAEITAFWKVVGEVAILWITSTQKPNITAVALKALRLFMNLISSMFQQDKAKARAIIEGIILGLRLYIHRIALYRVLRGASIEPPILRIRVRDIPVLLLPSRRKALYLIRVIRYVREHALV